MRRRFLCVPFFLLFTSGVLADQITLKNGDRLTGQITTGDGKNLLLKTEFVGEVTIEWDAITAIESSDILHLTLKDGKRLSGKVTTQDGKFVVAGAPEATPPAAKDTIVAVRNDAEQRAFDDAAEKMAHPKFTYFWGGVLDTGLALTRGNSSTASYTLSGRAIRETPRDKLTVYTTYVYASDNTTVPGRTTANAIRSGVRGDLNISPRVFVFAFADYETNELQNLDLRQVYGGGLGYHLIRTDRTRFDVFGGFAYDRDSFSSYFISNPAPPPPLTFVPSIVKNSAEALVGEEFASHLSKRSTLTQRFSFFPNLSHTGDYRFQFDTALATQVKNWLSWQFTFSDRYISYPPPGLKGNDLLLSTGLRVIWGKPKL